MAYLTLNDLRVMAKAEGVFSEDAPYSACDDDQLAAWLLFKKQITEKYSTIKQLILMGAKSPCDPDIAFHYCELKPGKTFPIVMKVTPGVFLGTTETVTVNANVPLYQLIDGHFQLVQGELSVDLTLGNELSLFYFPEDTTPVELTLESEHIRESVSIAVEKDSGEDMPPLPPIVQSNLTDFALTDVAQAG